MKIVADFLKIVANAGLMLRAAAGAFYLTVRSGSTLTAPRTLTVNTGDFNRTIDVSAADVTVSAYAATFLDDATAAAARTTLGLSSMATMNPAAVVITGGSVTSLTTLGLLNQAGFSLQLQSAAADVLTTDRVLEIVVSNQDLRFTLTGDATVSGTNTGDQDLSAYATTAALNAAVVGLLDFKGGTDCSANPNYPAALKGDSYVVSVAGKIGGASGKSVDVGDLFVASADNAGGTEASVGASWFVLEHNLTGALIATNNLSDVTNPATAVNNLGGAASTGTGGLVRATSPTLVTPALGTPSALVLTNATGLPVAGGGTGVASLTSNGVVIGNGTSAVTVTAEGATGKVLTGVTGGDPVFSDPVTASASEAVNTANHIITSASGTFEDVAGLTLTLPAAGTYEIVVTLRAQLSFSAGSNGFITARLDLNGSTVTNSETMVVLEPAINTLRSASCAFARKITATGAHVIKVQAKRDGTSVTFTQNQLPSDANGRCAISYLRIA